jgi:hypothetical protein
MSVAEHEEDEPSEPERCSIHELPRPCMACRDEQTDRKWQEYLEGRR